MYDVALKKAYKTAFDFIMPTLGVTKNIPPYFSWMDRRDRHV
jgi:hypothetical protein